MPLGNNNLTVALTLKAYDEMSKVVGEASAKSLRDLTKLSEKLRTISEQFGRFGVGAMASGFVAAGAMAAPLAAFNDLEEAGAALKASMLTDTGEVEANFEKVNALAVRLGTTFPGTTADITNMFLKLKQGGLSSEQILGGVGEATAKLAVVLRRDYAEVGETMARLANATGIQAKDMVAFTDQLQRAAGLGASLEQLEFAFARGGLLKGFGFTGLAAAKELTGIFGLLIRGGMSGRIVGTGLAGFVERLADPKKMAAFNAELRRFGVTFEAFDRHTKQFVGFGPVIRQLEQLRGLDPQALVAAFKPVFGESQEELSIVTTLIAQGTAGYQKAVADMEKKANLDQKAAVLLGTMANVWKAAYGTFKNALAIFGGAGADELIFMIQRFGDLSAWLAEFTERHRLMSKIIGLGILTFAGLAIGAGALSLAIAGVLRYLALVSGAAATTYGWLTRLAVVSAADRLRYLGIVPQAPGLWGGLGQRIGVTYGQLTRWTAETWASAKATVFNLGWLRLQATTMETTVWSSTVAATTATRVWTTAQWASLRAAVANAGGLRALALVAGRNVVAGLWAAAVAAKGLSLALLANPWTWVALAAIGAVLLIRKYWAPISGFFRGLFGGIAQGWAEVAERSIVLRAIGTVVWAILTPLRWLYNLIVAIIAPVEDVGQAWEHTGARIGRAIGRWVAMIINLPGQAVTAMFHAGAQIVEALWRGIQSAASKPVQAMMGIVKRIRDLLPFSPAKEGPLATLHQVRIIETIAETIRPTALVQRVTQTLQAARTAISPQPSAVDAPGVGRLAFAGAGNINITTHITVTGADTSGEGGPKALAQRIVQEQTMQLEKLMRRKYAI